KMQDNDHVINEVDDDIAPKTQNMDCNAISATPEQRAMQDGWKSFSRTDTGKVRKFNEDSILDRPDLGLWVVADGMGGHQAGDVASRKIINTLNKLNLSSSLDLSIAEITAALQLVNHELKELAAKMYGQQIIGSTVVALIAGKTHFAFLWAGDSRLYRLRDKKLLQLTIDHCSEQEDITDVLNLGSSTDLKQNNVITRAVGAYNELELDCQVVEIQSGDIFLLSSDGLDKEVSFQEIEQVLVENDYSDSVEILLERVLKRGARDNVSVIVVEIK
ncbi:MAG: SpoIIE family protein phosphatase, partial [Methylomarinum sp.]|nr:SpoIIE family protein phosphatase [Methylomarinum sp.]